MPSVRVVATPPGHPFDLRRRTPDAGAAPPDDPERDAVPDRQHMDVVALVGPRRRHVQRVATLVEGERLPVGPVVADADERVGAKDLGEEPDGPYQARVGVVPAVGERRGRGRDDSGRVVGSDQDRAVGLERPDVGAARLGERTLKTGAVGAARVPEVHVAVEDGAELRHGLIVVDSVGDRHGAARKP